jgi:hypothetical protein
MGTLILRRKMTMSSVKHHDSFWSTLLNSSSKLTMAVEQIWDFLTARFLCCASQACEPEPYQPTQQYNRPTPAPSMRHSLFSVPSAECPILPFRRSQASGSLRTPTRNYPPLRESRGSFHDGGLTDEDMRVEIRRLRGYYPHGIE